jgi:hypothetical protein
MSNPQEKAKELVEKYLSSVNGEMSIIKNSYFMSFETAKQCALIAVDEILFGLNAIADKYLELGMRTYWHAVKDEINKL